MSTSPAALRARLRRLEQQAEAQTKLGIGERLRLAKERRKEMTPEQRAAYWAKADRTPTSGECPLATRLKLARLRVVEGRAGDTAEG